MKNKVVFLMSSILLTGSLNAAELVEAIVARVGDRIVTRSQYIERLNDGIAELERTVPPASLAAQKEEYRRNLLNELLSELLIKDRADRIGITISSAELQDSIQRMKAQYGIKSDEEFNESIKKSGLTRNQLEMRMRESLLQQKVFAKELRSRAEMTDRELRERYDREKEHFRRPERARVREIVITPANETPAAISDASARAVQVAGRAKQGEDFAKLANEFSDAPTKASGGDLGEVAKGELLSTLDTAVFAANANTVVGPIQTRSGFHILKVEEKLASELPSFESVKEQLRKDASDETFQRDYKAYIERLRKEAYMQVYEENVPKA